MLQRKAKHQGHWNPNFISLKAKKKNTIYKNEFYSRNFFECRPNEVHFYNIVQIMYVPVSTMVKGFF